MAYNEAQPYLNQYNSGHIDAADAATVGLADTNQTAATLQSFAASGMAGSSELGELVGTVTKGNAKGGFQAGAGSSVDLSKLSMTQQILQSDLQIGMGYLQISSGQAADIAGMQQQQSEAMAKSLGQASQSFASVLGSNDGQTGTDVSLSPNTQYNGPWSSGDYNPTDTSALQG